MAHVDAAIAFAGRGLKIFPLPEGQKRPDIASYPERATSDPATIAQLWYNPVKIEDHNIGVLCGSLTGLIIIDIDTKFDRQSGQSAVVNYERIGGHWNTLIVQTGSGGYQAYYWLPKGLSFANATNIIANVDIRCENGYGIGPESFV